MPRKPHKAENSALNQQERAAIASLLKDDLTPDKLQSFLKKDQTITFRLSRYDKETLVATAKACDITVTDYLLKLHYLAMESLKKNKIL